MEEIESEGFKKILERIEYNAGDKTVELVAVAQQLMSTIEKELIKQDKLLDAGKVQRVDLPYPSYSMSMKDIEKKMDKMAGATPDEPRPLTWGLSIESMFLVFSAVAWYRPRSIRTEIGHHVDDGRLGLWFSFGGIEPSVEKCTKEWEERYEAT
jgi:hypothetical protein